MTSLTVERSLPVCINDEMLSIVETGPSYVVWPEGSR